jgi:hypothetical protein
MTVLISIEFFLIQYISERGFICHLINKQTSGLEDQLMCYSITWMCNKKFGNMTENWGIKERRTVIKRDILVAPLQKFHVNEAVILKWDTCCQVFSYVQSISSTEGYSYHIFSSVINHYCDGLITRQRSPTVCVKMITELNKRPGS